MNLSLSQILIDGLLLSIGLSVVIIGSLYFNPRLWLQDYPPAIIARVPPMTALEKRQRLVVALLFVAVGFVVLFNSLNRFHAENNGTPTLLAVFLHTYSVLLVFNLFDMMILDYLLLTIIRPQFAMIPGSERVDEGSLHLYWFHFNNFLKGLVICAVISAVIAVLVTLF